MTNKWVLKYEPISIGSNLYFANTPVLNSAVLFSSSGDAITVGVNYRTIDSFHKEAVVMQVDVDGATVLPSKNVQDQPLPPGH